MGSCRWSTESVARDRLLLEYLGVTSLPRVRIILLLGSCIRRKDGNPMAFAGLWDIWQPPDWSAAVHSCNIITTAANREMKAVHDRMPVILGPGQWREWLGAGTPGALKLLQPPSNGSLELYPVSTKVNNPRYQGHECIKRAE
nr:SOS response-associated peptidase family protein [Pelodictyon luteolum]